MRGNWIYRGLVDFRAMLFVCLFFMHNGFFLYSAPSGFMCKSLTSSSYTFFLFVGFGGMRGEFIHLTEFNLHLQICFFGRFKLKLLVEKKQEKKESKMSPWQQQAFITLFKRMVPLSTLQLHFFLIFSIALYIFTSYLPLYWCTFACLIRAKNVNCFQRWLNIN